MEGHAAEHRINRLCTADRFHCIKKGKKPHMKRIHIKKPDIKGFFTKLKNLKKEDIKRHFKERKERRQHILEQRRNSRFAKKMQPVYKWMNRLSLPLAVPACLRGQFSDRSDIQTFIF